MNGTPIYSWKLGNISIGAIAVKRIATGDLGARMDLWHELFHWVQDENYVMGWASINGDLRWWLETTAEPGTFLIEPDAASYNASLYGQSSLNDNRTLVYTLSPNQWVANEPRRQPWSTSTTSSWPLGCRMELAAGVTGELHPDGVVKAPKFWAWRPVRAPG